jgi:acyl-CoA synthetase (AMP-forming)/AMP-acid ligase II
MARETLLDFFADLAGREGEFLVYDDGYRSRSWRYDEVGRAARGFARALDEAGITKGHAVVLWCENRPEWVIALWGCLLSGVITVPIDYRSSPAFLRRVQAIVGARAVLVGRDVQGLDDGDPTPVWNLEEVCCTALARGDDGPPRPAVAVSRDDVA